jgi:phosphoglycerol transferase
MGAALALWLSDGDSLQKLKTPFAICAVVLVGSSGFYYAFFTAMFLGLSMTGATIEQRSLKPILACAGVSVAFVFLLLLSAYSYHMVHLLDGGIVSPPKRARWEQFSHGLVVGSALQVYADIGLFVQRGAEFIAATPDAIRTGEGTFREWPGVFLTTVIIMAPIALFPLLQMHDKRLRRVALSLAFITFGLLFAMRFGLGSIFTFLFTGAIRAQARIMPFLSFFAIVALCLGCTAIEQRNKRALVGMIVGSLLLTGTYRAIFILSHKQNLYLAHRPERVSLSSLAGVLAAKDSAGLKMIFQMPVMSWPEVPPVKQLADGQHMLPYLFDNRGTRWSYGLSYKEVPPYQALASNPQGIVSALSQIGFDGILIEKRGYEPAEADTLISTLKENGACIKHDDEIRTLFEIGKTCS